VTSAVAAALRAAGIETIGLNVCKMATRRPFRLTSEWVFDRMLYDGCRRVDREAALSPLLP